MKFSFLTYNVLFNKAFPFIDKIVTQYQPDIFCIQEVEIHENNLKLLKNSNYRIAGFSSSFVKFGKVFGVTTFYNKKKFSIHSSEVIHLPRGVYESFLYLIRSLRGGNRRRTVLKTELEHKVRHTKIIVYNTHLTVLGANGVRLKQIQKTLQDLLLDEKKGIIIAGDFNYLPYSRRKLEKLMKKRGLEEATSNISYTFDRKEDTLINNIGVKLFPSVSQLKLDYIFYKNLKNVTTKRINVHFSDHYPILSEFEK